MHLNSDSNIDLLVNGSIQTNKSVSKAYINDGNGIFSLKQNTEFIPFGKSEIEVTDINGDGYDDIFINPHTYINDGSGNFELLKSNPLNFSTSLHPYFKTKITDINNDNFDDLIISKENEVSIYENNNGQNFTNTSTLDIGFKPFSIIPINVNNDTKKDLLIRFINNDDKHELKLFIQTQNGLSTGSPFLINNLSVEHLAVIDFDGDKDDDLLIKYEQEPLKLFKNNNGIFENLPIESFNQIEIVQMKVADLDNDQDQDIVIIEKKDGKLITNLYLNDANNFTLKSKVLKGLISSFIEISDINNDSLNDIIIIGERNKWHCDVVSYIYLNNQDLDFSLVDSTSIQGLSDPHVLSIDLNNNKSNDLIISGHHCPNGNRLFSFVRYTNDGSGNFTKTNFLPHYNYLQVNPSVINYNGDNKQDLLLTGWKEHLDKSFLRIFSNHSESSTTSLFNFDNTKLKKATTIVYPNPINDEIFIDLNNKNNVSIIISTSYNKKVFSKNNVSNQILKIDAANLNSGLYFLEIITGEEKEVLKFIKE